MDIVTYQPYTFSRTNLNNHSIVTFLRYANSTVCLPGDNEDPSWRELLADGSFRTWLSSTDVFVASHHGRDAGYCEDVFAYCKPYLVVISDGPASETSALDKYRAKAKGWIVYSRATGASQERWALTTKADGSIFVTTGYNGNTPFLSVTTE
jgi:competence protein ComEC